MDEKVIYNQLKTSFLLGNYSRVFDVWVELMQNKVKTYEEEIY